MCAWNPPLTKVDALLFVCEALDLGGEIGSGRRVKLCISGVSALKVGKHCKECEFVLDGRTDSTGCHWLGQTFDVRRD